MQILVTGATGFIGKYLIDYLKELKHDVIVLTRNKDNAIKSLGKELTYLEWNQSTPIPKLNEFKKIDIVINLAGENIIGKRWGQSQKDKIYSSRVDFTRNLFKAIKKYKLKPSLFINASAIGYYGLNSKDYLDETSGPGNGFLAMVVHDWENEVRKHKELVERWAILRLGMVLGKGGGTVRKILPAFKLGMGATIGSGDQTLNWIHIKDLVRMIGKIIEDKSLSGIFNATSEFSVSNAEFTNVLSTLLQKPVFIKVPKMAVKTFYGEMSSILLDGPKVIPARFKSMRFHYHYPTIEKALKEVVSTSRSV